MNFMNLLQAAPAGNGMVTIVMIVLMLGVFYFLLIRPQKKEQKRFQNMLNELKKGDRIVTIGGIHGTISSVKENSVILKVDDNCKLEISKNGVASIVDTKSKTSEPAQNTSKEDAETEKKGEN